MTPSQLSPTTWAAWSRNLSPKSRRLGALACVAVVLLVHVGIRLRAEQHRPLVGLLGLYPHSYSRSISLVAGFGYERLIIGTDAASQPIKDFLDLKSPTLSVEQLAAYKASIPVQTGGDLGNCRQVDVLRSGDLYVAAAVWKVFGISWPALVRFYVAVSALACLAIFAAARRISGSFVVGLTAAALYAFCRFETTQVIRDANPIWFLAFATYTMVRLGGRQSAFSLALGGAALGVAAMIGYGWRPQLLFFAPLFSAAAVVRRFLDGDGMRRVALTATAFLLAAASVYFGYRSTIDPVDTVKFGSGFHVAYFGEQNRAALAGAENDLQICYDDSKVASDVYSYRTANNLEPSVVYDGEYSASIRTMYFEAARHHVSYWIRSLPTSIQAAITGKLTGDAWNTWRTAAFALFLIGLFSVSLHGVDRVALALLLTTMGFYFGIWFGISPERRHWGPFLVPVSIIGGFAPLVVQRLAIALRRDGLHRVVARPQAWYVPAALGICLLVWCATCLAADQVSAQARADYWQAAQEQCRTAVEVADSRHSPQRFQVDFPEGSTPIQRGYWVEVEAGTEAAELNCRHLRLSSRPIEPLLDWEGNPRGSELHDRIHEALWWNTTTQTRHRILPETRQVFFVTCGREPRCGDTRSYSLKIDLSGDAKITAVRECELSAWRRLPMSSVFQFDHPGRTPIVGGQSSTTLQQFATTPEALAEIGLNDVEMVKDSASKASRR